MPRKPVALTGILVACATPFTADGSAVDEDVLAAQVERLLAAGVHGLVPCGTTGEFPTLSPEEHRRVIELFVRAADGRVPVVAGVGSLSTQGAVDLAEHAEQAGADAIMLVPPFYDPLDLRTLKTFLSAVAEAITLPIVYYNVPGATGIRLTAAEIAELGQIDGVDYLKDTSGDAVTLAALLADPGVGIKAFNGWDTLTFFGLASGAEASVWGAANIVPELAVELWEAIAVKGDLTRGRELWRDLWAISDHLESVNYVAGVKAGLEIIGHPAGPTRAPVQPLDEPARARLVELLTAAGAVAAAS